MKTDRQIDKIIDEYTPDIASGQETIDSILEKHPQYARELRPRLEAVLWMVTARKNLEPRPTAWNLAAPIQTTHPSALGIQCYCPGSINSTARTDHQ
jgi:hypothetical protein